jgi:hypothetical protein
MPDPICIVDDNNFIVNDVQLRYEAFIASGVKFIHIPDEEDDVFPHKFGSIVNGFPVYVSKFRDWNCDGSYQTYYDAFVRYMTPCQCDDPECDGLIFMIDKDQTYGRRKTHFLTPFDAADELIKFVQESGKTREMGI